MKFLVVASRVADMQMFNLVICVANFIGISQRHLCLWSNIMDRE
uniref:Uncharacterized protein n=1 Tax=Rhizophora mucronata TaxID=61149 RepID=A0A2P2J256_RHIMU